MITRKADLEDLESLSILFDKYRKFYKMDADIIGAGIFLKNRLINKDSEIFIIEHENHAMLGFVQLYPLFSSTRMMPLWLLNDLFVAPEYRNKGVAIALIDECKNLCIRTKSCGMILETAKDNTIGNNLYIKTGFSADKDHNYYEWEVERL